VTLTKGGGSTIATVSGTTDAVSTFSVTDTVAETTVYTAHDTTDSALIAQTASVFFAVARSPLRSRASTRHQALVNADGSRVRPSP
jgi:hypothetical protein